MPSVRNANPTITPRYPNRGKIHIVKEWSRWWRFAIFERLPAYEGAQEKDATFWNEVMHGKTINQSALPSKEGEDWEYRRNGVREILDNCWIAVTNDNLSKDKLTIAQNAKGGLMSLESSCALMPQATTPR